MRISIPAMLSAAMVAAAWPAHGSVIAFASGSLGHGPTFSQITNSPLVAIASVRATPNVQGPPIVEKLSAEGLDDPTCLTCDYWDLDARAAADASGGVVKMFTRAGIIPGPDTEADALVEIHDLITFHSPTVGFSMTGEISELLISIVGNPNIPFTSRSTFQMGFYLRTLEGDPVYQANIDIVREFFNPNEATHYQVFDQVGQDGPYYDLTLSGLPPGPYRRETTLDLAAFVGQQLELEFRVHSSSKCVWQEYRSVAGSNCISMMNSWHTSYLGLDGNFTSQNGYQYLGSPNLAAVPEPSGFMLGGLAGVMLAVRYRRRGR